MNRNGCSFWAGICSRDAPEKGNELKAVELNRRGKCPCWVHLNYSSNLLNKKREMVERAGLMSRRRRLTRQAGARSLRSLRIVSIDYVDLGSNPSTCQFLCGLQRLRSPNRVQFKQFSTVPALHSACPNGAVTLALMNTRFSASDGLLQGPHLYLHRMAETTG